MPSHHEFEPSRANLLVRCSYGSLLAAIPVAIAAPWLSFRASQRTPGWDDLSDSLGLLFWGCVLFVLCLLASAICGALVARKRRFVLWWTVPLITAFAAALVAVAAIGVGQLANGGHFDDVTGTAAFGFGVTAVTTIALWALDAGAGFRWRRMSWWLVGIGGFALTIVWGAILSLALN